MKQILALLLITLSLAFSAGAAEASCYVEYKAKQDSPLRLHYGVLEISGDCPSSKRAKREAQARLASGGWVLLNVLGMSTSLPTDKMKANAGVYYLRY